MTKRWNLRSASPAAVTDLQQQLKISPVVCQLLVERGITSYEAARSYFRPSLNDLHDPWLMKDMEKAVGRIQEAAKREEKILVFGDYDVDGTTAVASMYQFLQEIINPRLLDFYIPHRYREGYGVSLAGIEFARANDFKLIISLDCGIKSVELVAHAASLGIDFIICDHHLPDPVLPEAVAILNPKQSDCSYPYKELCGCGVGFKLMCALANRFQLPQETCFKYLDLLATAIAADIVPITGENRILAWFGLQQINTMPCPGIKALIELGGIRKKLTINTVVFVIAPRVNAAGRMDDARKAVKMFIEQNPRQAMELAEELHHDNSDRKEADSSITEEALTLIKNEGDQQRFSTVVYQEHWHKGVVGIVASRLTESYYRPTVVLTQSGEVAAGSARSVAGFNLYEAIHACKDYLLGYGGHFAAAGLSLLPENIPAFRQRFEEVVRSTIDPQLLIPEIKIDSEISFHEIRKPFYAILEQMEPFGPDNTRPVFIARNVTESGYSKVVKEQHIRFVVKQSGVTLTGIGFNLADKFPLLQQQQPLDIVFTIDENEWNGNVILQLRVIDFSITGQLLAN